MAVPAKPFYLKAAYTEFGKALNTGVSGVMTAQGLTIPDYAGDLAGTSASEIHTLVVANDSNYYYGYWWVGPLGSFTPQQSAIAGGNFGQCQQSIIDANRLYIQQSDGVGAFPNAFRITIVGLGSVWVPAGNTGALTLTGVLDFFRNRVGQSIQVTISKT